MLTPMDKETYDKDFNDIVDEAEKVKGIRVVVALPETGLAGELVMLNTNKRTYVWVVE